MTEKTRTCETCAFGTLELDGLGEPLSNLCHYDNRQRMPGLLYWCRHWAETTGWDVFKEMPTQLEHRAFEIFQRLRTETDHQASRIERWLEEYRRKC